jgi:hypothetical protein
MPMVVVHFAEAGKLPFDRRNRPDCACLRLADAWANTAGHSIWRDGRSPFLVSGCVLQVVHLQETSIDRWILAALWFGNQVTRRRHPVYGTAKVLVAFQYHKTIKLTTGLPFDASQPMLVASW